jgi:7-carboxy-7-deazaguanine synthase
VKGDSWLYYDEIFASIQGESSQAGFPCVFVRLYGCNVGCKFCDQKQCSSDRKKISIGKLVNRVLKYKIPRVCITGGEPMLQWNAIYPVILELVGEGCKVSIETSGCVPIEFDDYKRSFNYVMDVKCPSSGVSHKNILDNLMRLRTNDEVKFVISNEEDYEYAKRVMAQYPTPAKILFSPCFTPKGKPMVGKKLVDWMIRDGLNEVRVQIQMHKVLLVH